MSDLYPSPVPNQAWLGKKFGDLWSAVRDLQGASRRAASADDLVLVSGTLDDAVSDIAALTAQINLLSPSGFVPLVPTASTGTTVADDGLVTFNGASCDLLDLFSADFDVYWGWMDCSLSAQEGINLRLRTSGAVATTNYEHSQVSNAGTGTPVGSSTVGTSAWIIDGGMSGQRHWGSFLIFDPFAAASTRIDSGFSARRTAGPLSSTAKRGGIHTTSSSYTGLRFLSSGSATITGEARFYGVQGLLLP